jgi:ferritin-like metal-binding protein YciE
MLTMTPKNEAVIRDVFVLGLKNAHAMEHEAMALMDRQIGRLKNYDEVEARLREHRDETEQQIARLKDILEEMDESPSGMKDAALGLSGNLAAMGHAMAEDEILKNSFANYAFENFEVASYRSLLVLCEGGGFDFAAERLSESLEEEEAMARWVAEGLPELTERYVELKAAGENASR